MAKGTFFRRTISLNFRQNASYHHQFVPVGQDVCDLEGSERRPRPGENDELDLLLVVSVLVVDPDHVAAAVFPDGVPDGQGGVVVLPDDGELVVVDDGLAVLAPPHLVGDGVAGHVALERRALAGLDRHHLQPGNKCEDEKDILGFQ